MSLFHSFNVISNHHLMQKLINVRTAVLKTHFGNGCNITILWVWGGLGVDAPFFLWLSLYMIHREYYPKFVVGSWPTGPCVSTTISSISCPRQLVGTISSRPLLKHRRRINKFKTFTPQEKKKLCKENEKNIVKWVLSYTCIHWDGMEHLWRNWFGGKVCQLMLQIWGKIL